MKSLNFDSFYLFILPPLRRQSNVLLACYCFFIILFYHVLLRSSGESSSVSKEKQTFRVSTKLDKHYFTWNNWKIKRETENKFCYAHEQHVYVTYVLLWSLMPPRLPQMPFIIIIITNFDLSFLVFLLRWSSVKKNFGEKSNSIEKDYFVYLI